MPGDATTGLTIAALQGVEMSPSFEHVELYGMESVMRKAVAKHSLKVKVTCKYAMWDPSTDQILNLVMTGGATSDPFTTGTATTTDIDAPANKNNVALFTITAAVNPSDSQTLTLTYTAHDVYFEGVPFNMTQHEFITRDLSGTAKYITVSKGAGTW